MVGGGVLPQFGVVRSVAQLPFSFFDVIFLAEHNHCRPFVCGFDDYVSHRCLEVLKACLSVGEWLSGF